MPGGRKPRSSDFTCNQPPDSHCALHSGHICAVRARVLELGSPGYCVARHCTQTRSRCARLFEASCGRLLRLKSLRPSSRLTLCVSKTKKRADRQSDCVYALLMKITLEQVMAKTKIKCRSHKNAFGSSVHSVQARRQREPTVHRFRQGVRDVNRSCSPISIPSY